MMSELKASRGGVIAALATLYLVWGSTYLAIRFAIETLPPFLMAGARFLSAGVLLYAWARWRGAPRPAAREWGGATLIGGLLLLGGNGGVVWAEQRVPSGLAALLVATVPLWMVLLESLMRDGRRPAPQVWLGIGLGLAGVLLLVGPGEIAGGRAIDPWGAGVLILASLSWAYGSLVSRRMALPSSPLLATAMEMLGGGVLLAAAGTAAGEWGQLDPGAVTLRSATSLAYLSLFGSIVAFSAYIWLLRVASPALVSTYAFVNPVVAVLLGWAFAGEPLNARTLAAAGIIVAGVVVITTSGRRRGRPERAAARLPAARKEAA